MGFYQWLSCIEWRLIRLFKVALIIISILSIGINIALLTSGPNGDKVILDIADDSYFIGCYEASKDSPACHGKSKLYRKEFREHTGMED